MRNSAPQSVLSKRCFSGLERGLGVAGGFRAGSEVAVKVDDHGPDQIIQSRALAGEHHDAQGLSG